MGGPKKWLKSILRHRKTQSISQDMVGQKSRSIWRSWMGCSTDRQSTESFDGASAEPPEITRSMTDRAFDAAVATVVRAPARDFLVIKQEWAAIRIQTAFRGLLARRALRALRALVKIQAMVRGWQVRKQAAVMLQSMQALVNLQVRVRAGNLSMSSEERKIMCERSGPTDTFKPIKETWCSSPRTMEEIRSRLQMRQVGVLKRERAIAYSKSQQKLRPQENSSPMKNKAVASPKTSQRLDKNIPKSRWLAHWMEGDKPWENGYTEEVHTNLSERTLSSRNISYCSEHYCSGNARRNNVMGSICTQPACQQISSSSTDFSSDFLLESSASPSSVSTPSINVGRSNVHACTCTKPHPSSPRIKPSSSDQSSGFLQESIASCSSVSSPQTNEFEHALAMERIDGSLPCIPNYMSLTKSVKAKQVAKLPEHLLEDF